MRYDGLMGRRSGGKAATPQGLERLLRPVVPLALLIFAGSALRFALMETPGVADVAHLRAIALPIGRLLGWIGGHAEVDLLPAPARFAPLPLLVDWLLWRLTPLGTTGLRIVHVAMATGALALLLHALAIRLDRRVAALAGLVAALSPRFVEAVTVLGVDPFVFSLFCVQLAILLTRGKIGGPEPLILFVAVGALAGLCGTGGMIAAASLFAGLLFNAPDGAAARRRALAILPALVVWALPLALLTGAGATADAVSARGLASLAVKIATHNADLLLRPGALALVGGTAVLIALGLHGYGGRLARIGRSERTHPFALLLFVALTGIALSLIAGPLLRVHPWTEPAAQAWLGLMLLLLAAACFTPRLIPVIEWRRRLRRVAAGLLVAGALSGAIAHHHRAAWFVSGPQAGLARVLDAAGPNRAIVYAGHDWGRAYFPHAWEAPGDNEQWLLALDGRSVRRILPGGQTGDPRLLGALEGYDALVVTRIDRRGWRDLQAVRNARTIGAMPPARLDHFPAVWRAEPARAAPGEYWLTTQILRRAEALGGAGTTAY